MRSVRTAAAPSGPFSPVPRRSYDGERGPNAGTIHWLCDHHQPAPSRIPSTRSRRTAGRSQTSRTPSTRSRRPAWRSSAPSASWPPAGLAGRRVAWGNTCSPHELVFLDGCATKTWIVDWIRDPCGEEVATVAADLRVRTGQKAFELQTCPIDRQQLLEVGHGIGRRCVWLGERVGGLTARSGAVGMTPYRGPAPLSTECRAEAGFTLTLAYNMIVKMERGPTSRKAEA
jgi:hypothetical protein